MQIEFAINPLFIEHKIHYTNKIPFKPIPGFDRFSLKPIPGFDRFSLIFQVNNLPD